MGEESEAQVTISPAVPPSELSGAADCLDRLPFSSVYTVEPAGQTSSAAADCVGRLMGDTSITSTDLKLVRDYLGKPSMEASKQLKERAEAAGVAWDGLQVTNSNDGGRNLTLVAADAELVGLGVDLVHLPRVRRLNPTAVDLRRLARRFMSREESRLFEAACADVDLDGLRIETIARFALMEAASKALGTGLRMGLGLGGRSPLSHRSIGATAITPTVEMLWSCEARDRMTELRVGGEWADWSASQDWLCAVVALRRVGA